MSSANPKPQLDEIEARICRWASWARCASPGQESLSEGYLRERTDAGHDGEPTEEIVRTERAINGMRLSRPDYWRYFKRYYLTPPSGLSEYEVSRDTRQPLERIREILDRCRKLIAYDLEGSWACNTRKSVK